MSRQPVVGGDNAGWGAILNDYLSVSLSTGGTLRGGMTVGSSSNVTINGQTNQVTNLLLPVNSTSPNQQIGLLLQMQGSNVLSSSFFRIPLGIFIQTGGSGAGGTPDGIEPINIVVQQNSSDSVAFGNGIELAFNNLKRNDPLNPVDANHYGMTVDAYGGFSIGPAAIAIRTAASNSNWQRAVWIPVNSVTPGTGFAFAYDGNGTNGAVTISENAQTVIGSTATTSPTLTVGNGITVSTGAVLANGGVTIAGGSFATGRLYKDATQGFTIGSITGATYDFDLFNPGGSQYIMRVPTGTAGVDFVGGIMVGSPGPTGGNKGNGTINVSAGYYANGSSGVTKANVSSTFTNMVITNGIITSITT